MTDVAPPDTTVWWDPVAVQADALAVLRLADTDVDADRIADLVAVAGAAINDYLDRPADAPVPPVPAAPAVLVDAIVQVVVELYRRKDSPPSSVEGMLASAWRPASIDALAAVRPLIRPYKARHGIA